MKTLEAMKSAGENPVMLYKVGEQWLTVEEIELKCYEVDSKEKERWMKDFDNSDGYSQVNTKKESDMLVRDDYILRPSDCYDYKVMTRVNQQVNKIFDDLEEIEAKPKSCDSCHYSISNEVCKFHEVSFYDDDYDLQIGEFKITKDFYCSEYEPKDKA